MAKWVRHISGQGEKFKVINAHGKAWFVGSPVTEEVNWDLPMSEYVECEPPERWEDVECHVPDPGFLVLDTGAYIFVPNHDYQFVRVSNNKFKIQKKVLDNSEKP